MRFAPRIWAGRTVRIAIGSPMYGRALMVGQLPSVTRKRDPTSQALARALRAAALGRLSADEREWVGRVEARHRELAADETPVEPGFEAEPGEAPVGFLGSAPVGGIAQWFGVPPRWGTFLLRLVRELAPQSCLELGTGIGLSTAYQAAALEINGTGTLTTLDNARGWAGIAQQGLSALGLEDRVDIQVGTISNTASTLLGRIAPVDYAFLDAEHTEQATVRDFELVLPHLSSGGVVVLDDIGLSRAMRRAWNQIRRRNGVSTSLLLGRMGVIAVSR